MWGWSTPKLSTKRFIPSVAEGGAATHRFPAVALGPWYSRTALQGEKGHSEGRGESGSRLLGKEEVGCKLGTYISAIIAWVSLVTLLAGEATVSW